MTNLKQLEQRLERLEHVAANKENPLKVEHWLVSSDREEIDEDGNIAVIPSRKWPFQRFTANQPDSMELFIDGEWQTP